MVWAMSTKARPWWTLYINIGARADSCLHAPVERMPIGTAYVVWTGIGAAGSALVGIGLFGESASRLRLRSMFRPHLGPLRSRPPCSSASYTLHRVADFGKLFSINPNTVFGRTMKIGSPMLRGSILYFFT
jgi:Small Multidrug Resistance (SMR) protein